MTCDRTTCDKPALGLSRQDRPEKIRETVFRVIHEVGYMMFSTVALDGLTPTARGLEVHYLDESGDLFIGLCPGKPVYAELKKNPRICGGLIVRTKGRLTYGIRLNAVAEEVSDGKLMAAYWRQNPGTAKLYRRAPENFTLFRLKEGDGEIIDVYEDDALLRFRFGFGGEKPRPWLYEIGSDCNGCGLCARRCMTQVISMVDGRAVIDHAACLECGACFSCCPQKAVIKNDWGKI